MNVITEPTLSIVRGEGEVVEFKRAIPSLNELTVVLSGFAGGAGGLLVIGADEDGAVVGVPPEAKSLIRKRVSAAISSLPFEGAWRMGSEQVDDRAIMFVEVQPGSDAEEYLADELASALGRILASNRTPLGITRRVLVEIIPFGQALASKMVHEPELVHQLSPGEFEEFISERLFAMGFEPQRIGSYNQPDGGIGVLFWPRNKHSFPF